MVDWSVVELAEKWVVSKVERLDLLLAVWMVVQWAYLLVLANQDI